MSSEYVNLYKSVTHQARTVLVGTVNVIIGIFIMYVYPLERFGIIVEDEYISVLNTLASSQVQLILLSLVTSALLTYFYMATVNELTPRSAMILHTMVMINIIVSAIQIEIAFFTSISLIIAMGLTIFSLRLLPQDNHDLVIAGGIIGLNIGTLVIWFTKQNEEINMYDPLISVIILSILGFVLCRNEFRRKLLILPLFSNVILITVIDSTIYDY